MESSVGYSSSVSGSVNLYSASVQKENYSADLLVLQASFKSETNDAASVGINFQDLYKGLSVSAKQMVDKINELLKAKVPNGVQSLSPSEVTPEATADRIVQGATSYFSVYSEQNPDLEGEDLIDSFMKTIRSGIDSGYSDAFNTLKGLGAFGVDGVQSGVEKTKSLIEEKLQKYEDSLRVQMGLEPKYASTAEDVTSDTTATEVLKQAGGSLLNITA